MYRDTRATRVPRVSAAAVAVCHGCVAVAAHTTPVAIRAREQSWHSDPTRPVLLHVVVRGKVVPDTRGKAKTADGRLEEMRTHRPSLYSSKRRDPIPSREMHVMWRVDGYHAASDAHGTTTSPLGHVEGSVVNWSPIRLRAVATAPSRMSEVSKSKGGGAGATCGAHRERV